MAGSALSAFEMNRVGFACPLGIERDGCAIGVGKIARGLSGGKDSAAPIGSGVPTAERVSRNKERRALADFVGFAVFGDYVIGHGTRCRGA